MPSTVNQQLLIDFLAKIPDCLVAFSGGVDSAVVAKAARVALGDRAIAVTGVSASLATGELEIALRIATAIGIRHEVIHTDELADANYLANAPSRCFHCKTELYNQMRVLAEELGFTQLVNGTNADDLGDFRPGLQAAAEHRVLSPLVECGINKQGVRQLALDWELEVWDKPASPCLSSRVVYGLEISPERLARIDAAEALLKLLGFTSVRVRCHHDELARLEVAADEIGKLADHELRTTIACNLRELGFRYVTIDLEGFRSGSFLPLVMEHELISGADRSLT
jgi:pyridinium-3,5-biscarboxylic acid mononucleotide sulfurtransferase